MAGGDGVTGMAGERDDRFDELRIFFLQGIEFVEERINVQRTDEDQEGGEGNRAEPGIEPPGAGLAANRGEKQQDEEKGEGDGEELGFGPVPQPGGPGLDGLLIEEREMMPIETDGQIQKSERGE